MKIETPRRVTHTYTQHLVAPPDRVFPLLCPVREADWLDGWDPLRVSSHSGLAERDCVFLTDTAAPAAPAIWYITRHEPENGQIEMLKITPGLTACRLNIELRSAPGGSEATVTYCHTSLGPQGDAFLAGFTPAYYQEFMREWETRLNHFLGTGTLLRGPLA